MAYSEYTVNVTYPECYSSICGRVKEIPRYFCCYLWGLSIVLYGGYLTVNGYRFRVPGDGVGGVCLYQMARKAYPGLYIVRTAVLLCSEL